MENKCVNCGNPLPVNGVCSCAQNADKNQTAQPIQTPQPVQPIQPVQPVQPVYTAPPVSSPQPVQAPQPVQPIYTAPPVQAPQNVPPQQYDPQNVQQQMPPQGYYQNQPVVQTQIKTVSPNVAHLGSQFTSTLRNLFASPYEGSKDAYENKNFIITAIFVAIKAVLLALFTVVIFNKDKLHGEGAAVFFKVFFLSLLADAVLFAALFAVSKLFKVTADPLGIVGLVGFVSAPAGVMFMLFALFSSMSLYFGLFVGIAFAAYILVLISSSVKVLLPEASWDTVMRAFALVVFAYAVASFFALNYAFVFVFGSFVVNVIQNNLKDYFN